MNKCYFKKIAESTSREGKLFIKRFAIDYQRCENRCTGYFGYGTCDNYITQMEVDMGGLSKVMRSDDFESKK